MLIAGGGDSHASATNVAEIYNPANDVFTPAGSGFMPGERTYHTATLLKDGRVLIAGGMNRMGKALATAVLFDPRGGRFIPTGSMAEPRYEAAATLLDDGRVLVSGGASTSEGYAGAGQERQEEQSTDTAELYDPVTGRFSSAGKSERVYDITSNRMLVRASMTAARRAHTATLIAAGPLAGQVLIAGGIGDQNKPLASAELYDPKANAFTPTGSMLVARSYQTATALRDGRVLVAGGTDAADKALATAEIYKPSAGKFTLTPQPMRQARYRQSAVLLDNGTVLLAGGASNSGVLANAEIFDPRTALFRSTGLMKDYRMAAGAVLLRNGTVFIAGGYNNRPTYAPGAISMGSAAVSFRALNTAEIYYPPSGQFVDTRSLGAGSRR
ncbi:MAG TPA: kelch repeat-containing protein [Bryobacteraceae bacterium]|nr:kelch repeat-containing protein [Bryobacteraceae bacterium]